MMQLIKPKDRVIFTYRPTFEFLGSLSYGYEEKMELTHYTSLRGCNMLLYSCPTSSANEERVEYIPHLLGHFLLNMAPGELVPVPQEA